MTSRTPYTGPRRKLVLAFDVGTTFSGISYSVLDPGRVPEIKGVTKYPAQDHVSGASKIPSVIYYDTSGKVRAVGAEAMRDGILEQAEDEGWNKAEWFKLHLRSRLGPGAGAEVSSKAPPLPPNKTVVDVFADFLVYLFECASTYIQETHANGVDLWKSSIGQISFVLSHPNGWEGAQQTQMRKAAIQAKLIPDTVAGNARLSFVTEGEASLHFAIQNGLPDGALKNGEGIVIVDAGGGTIDISSYSRNMAGDAAKLSFEEIAAPQCHFQGSVFVNNNARVYLQNYLEGSDFEDDLEHIVRCFDKTTKPRFRDPKDAQYIKFGSARDNDPTINVRSGQLKLVGSDVASFFAPSVECIVKTIQQQRRTAHKGISHVILVGGFGASDYLLTQITNTLKPLGISVVRPESHVNKAVSDGSISFFLDHFVRTRVAKLTYGSPCSVLYDPTDIDHVRRASQAYTDPSGDRLIGGSFDVILAKDVQVSETKEFKRSYQKELNVSERSFTAEVWCYRGQHRAPLFTDVDLRNFTPLCHIVLDLSQIPVTQHLRRDGTGYYSVVKYDMVLIFGMTELKAQVAWKDKNNKERRSKAKIIYDPEDSQGDL